MRIASSLTLVLTLALAGCSVPRMDMLGPVDEPVPRGGQRFSDIPYASWSDYEPDYRFYPGDELELALPSAPELSKTRCV